MAKSLLAPKINLLQYNWNINKFSYSPKQSCPLDIYFSRSAFASVPLFFFRHYMNSTLRLLFSCKKNYKIDIVAILFVFHKYCSIME